MRYKKTIGKIISDCTAILTAVVIAYMAVHAFGDPVLYVFGCGILSYTLGYIGGVIDRK